MLEAINTAATVATLVVLTAGAIAAAVQLRHMRTGNQLQAFIDIYNRAQTQGMLDLFDSVIHDIPKIAQDAEYIEQVRSGAVRMSGGLLRLAFWFDEVGISLREGVVRERVIFQVGASAYTTVRCWRAMLPIIEAVRVRSPGAFLHFEYAAVRAQQWIEKYPGGDYPKDAPRWAQMEQTLPR